VQFLQPTEDAIAVSRELRKRTGLPMWQYTLSASTANTEIIRIARAFTGREKIVLFEGKYHGHIDATMTEGGEPGSNSPGKPAGLGLPVSAAANSITIPFNDPDALARALASGDVALVMTEPALTNCHLVLPEPGFLADAAQMAHNAGALFALDETHTWQFAFGGMNRTEGAEADFVALGKGMGSGVPLGAYGMTTPLACFVAQNLDDYTEANHGLAIGGTTFASALTMAAARATLEDCLTEKAYVRTARLGKILADGIDAAIAQAGLPWRAFRHGPRSGFCLSADFPRNYSEALASFDMEFINARRIFMANRGIWEAIAPAGPQVSFAHSTADVDSYIAVTGEFLREATAIGN
jgi:glutamate-1-semialdehyde aminotransferase